MKRLFFCLLAIMISTNVWARDLGQWEGSDPAVRDWYAGLMQPDNPRTSCCGEADAYWCDDIHVRDGKTYCTITDDRNDELLKRKLHVPVGTEIFIPDHKLTWKDGNPTGHAIVFLYASRVYGADGSEGNPDYQVYCFVQPTGS